MARHNNKSRSRFALSGKRLSGVLDERKFFLIVTEGKTEAQYFKYFSSTTGPRIEPIDKQDSKVSLVKKAIALRDQYIKEKRYIEGDETWVVFDRDVDSKKPNDKETFNQALELASKNNIQVAYSNDSFELWLLLHLQVVSTAIHRDDIEKKLKEHLGSYKHGGDVFDKINANYGEAVKRAKKICCLQAPLLERRIVSYSQYFRFATCQPVRAKIIHFTDYPVSINATGFSISD